MGNLSPYRCNWIFAHLPSLLYFVIFSFKAVICHVMYMLCAYRNLMNGRDIEVIRDVYLFFQDQAVCKQISRFTDKACWQIRKARC